MVAIELDKTLGVAIIAYSYKKEKGETKRKRKEKKNEYSVVKLFNFENLMAL